MHAESPANLPRPRPPARGSRVRSLPYRSPFVGAVALSSLHYLGLVAALTSLAIIFIEETMLATQVFAASLAFSGAAWFLAFFKRRSTYCPLCKGTPLINSGAHVHEKAFRVPPLNHGVSATLSIIFTQKFRCMYCGSHFDLLKKPGRRLSDNAASTADDDCESEFCEE